MTNSFTIELTKLCKKFPYWTETCIKNTIDNLVKNGLLTITDKNNSKMFKYTNKTETYYNQLITFIYNNEKDWRYDSK